MKRTLAVLLLTLGCRPPAAPAPPPAGPAVEFALYGDSRTGDDIHREICAALLKTEARFVIATGDLAEDGEDTKSWERWREITKELRAKVPYWSCRGDHDLGPSGHFDRELGVDRPYFERERDGIHFFFLDSTTDFERGAQVKWLEERARVSQARHKIAVFHHPPYTIKEGREERAKRIFDLIHATLERLGFCAAFCGHDHHFFTTRRDRVRYVVTGGGGAPLYSLNPKLAKKRDRYLAFHHFVLCRSDANGITAKVYGPAGSYPEIHFVVCRHDGPVEE